MGADQGLIKKEIASMMNSLIKFEKTHVEEVMTRRNDILILNGNKTIDECIDFVVKSPY
ncbi:MAG: hypothetical protein JRI49_09545 [Deltaproteobacteria bacterium]|nr:hypothetical protein [Deltaproteobacteria bacterium]